MIIKSVAVWLKRPTNTGNWQIIKNKQHENNNKNNNNNVETDKTILKQNSMSENESKPIPIFSYLYIRSYVV